MALYHILFMFTAIATAYSLTCFSGQVIIGHPNASQLPVKRETCEEPTDSCITIKYSMSFLNEDVPVNVSSVQGACGLSALGCNFVCKKLESVQTVKDCQTECCTTDFCNMEVGKHEKKEATIPPVTDIITYDIDKEHIKDIRININNTSICFGSNCVGDTSLGIQISINKLLLLVTTGFILYQNVS